MATVSLTGLEKVYPNGFKAIHGIDLDIADGEFVVLVGPSGCGKSTLLRMIAGLETITSGDLEIDGRRVNDVEPSERDIAMVFQNYALYPHMTVFGNMAYGLRNRGTPKADITAKVNEVAAILELGDFLPRKPNQLSGGQRQRVAMGRAIVRSPKAFLFDEPLSNLDAKLRVQMRIEIRHLQRTLGTTAVYVTHDQVEAMTMADRLVVLNEGRAEQIGTPMQVYTRPATRFVAGFIGSPAMNFLTAEAVDGKVRLSRDGGPAMTAPPGVDGPVILGIRPEHLQPAAEAADINLRVDATELLGADTLVYGTIDDAAEPIVARLPGVYDGGMGHTLPLRLDRENLHLFDVAQGNRLG